MAKDSKTLLKISGTHLYMVTKKSVDNMFYRGKFRGKLSDFAILRCHG